MGSLQWHNSHTKFHKNELGNLYTHIENWNRKVNQTDPHNLQIGFE